MLALWRVRVGSGFIKAQATKALGDGAVTHSPCVCVYTNTHLCTQVRQLCLDRATLPVTFSAEVHRFFTHSYIPLRSQSPSETWKYVYEIQIQSISRRFRFHQVSDEGGLRFLKEPRHSVTYRRPADVTPNVWVVPHMGKCLSSCALFSNIGEPYYKNLFQIYLTGLESKPEKPEVNHPENNKVFFFHSSKWNIMGQSGWKSEAQGRFVLHW